MATKVTMYGPAVFELQVRGALDESWIDLLGVETIILRESPEQGAISVLTGNFHDQAALRGLLERLYVLNLPLLAVRHVDGP